MSHSNVRPHSQPSTQSTKSSTQKHAQKNFRYYTSLTWRLTSKLEEAVKTYQKALQLHQEKRWAEAERAYLNLLMTEIVADRLSKKVRIPFAWM
jgi:hypothetical protein